MAERKRRIIFEQAEVGGPMTFGVEGYDERLVVNHSDFPEEIQVRNKDQGAKTKISRFTAGVMDAKEAFMAMKTGVEAMKAGTWSQVGTGISAKMSGMLVTLRKVPKKNLATIVAALREQDLLSLTDEELRANGVDI